MQKIARAVIPVNRSCDRLVSTTGDRGNLTAKLAEANARLHALRASAQGHPTGRTQPVKSAEYTLPPHLGWQSAPLSHATSSAPKATPQHDVLPIITSSAADTRDTPPAECKPNTKLHPQLAFAFLKQEVTIPARIWLLLKQLDSAGRGWISVADAKTQLCGNGARYRVCGWRQLRNCLQAGQGVFWQRDATRIWLRSTARVACSLGVDRLGTPLQLSTNSLCGKLQSVRASFYAIGLAAHKGPISRMTLATLSGLDERTQRRYDQRAPIKKQSNYCLQATSGCGQEAAWHHRHAAFDFVDHQGKQGAKGRSYRAFQLPNSYSVTLEQARFGRTRKINQQLQQDLVTIRAQGNGCGQDDVATFSLRQNRSSGRKLFFENGQQFKKGANDVYVKSNQNAQRTFWTHWA